MNANLARVLDTEARITLLALCEFKSATIADIAQGTGRNEQHAGRGLLAACAAGLARREVTDDGHRLRYMITPAGECAAGPYLWGPAR